MNKTYKLLAVACLAGLTLSSCVKDDEFLKENPKNIYTIDNAYGTAEQVVSTLATAYVSIQGNYYGVTGKGASTDLYGAFYIFGGPTSTLGSWNTDQGKNNWDTHYKNIAYANQALYAADLPQISWVNETEKMQLQAEARFVRGYSYLRLAEFFGGVPIVEEYNTALRLDYERSTRKQTYEFAIEDLEFAYANMPVHANIGRPGKGAAGMVLAEAYLALGVEDSSQASSCFSKAAEYAQGVIDIHPMMTRRFGCRANASDRGANLGVPNYNPDGTVYSDLFYGQNPRLAENTEAIWIVPGARSYAENNQYKNGSSAPLRTNSPTMSAPALRDVLLVGSSIKPWNTGGDVSPFYQGPAGACSSPAIVPQGVPFVAPPTWYAQVEQFDDAHNKGSYLKDARCKEGVAIRMKYPVTNPNHPRYGLEVYYGTDAQMCGWDDIDKSNVGTAMEYFGVFDKMIGVDAWGCDADDYYTATMAPTSYKDFYIYRSAEAYLLLAEANLRQGNAALAAQALNAVRERSNATPFSDSEITLQTILDERGRELVYEEDRWATFLRQEPELWKERIYAYGQYTYRKGAKLNPDAPLYPTTQQFDSWTGEIKWNLWPIPLTYIDLNTDNPEGMTQNPGWDAE